MNVMYPLRYVHYLEYSNCYTDEWIANQFVAGVIPHKYKYLQLVLFRREFVLLPQAVMGCHV